MPIKNIKSSSDLTIVSLELVCDKNEEKNDNLYLEQERVPEILSGEFESTIFPSLKWKWDENDILFLHLDN